MRDLANAIPFYKNYLRELPDAPNRDTVEKRIKELTESMEKERLAAEKAPQDPIVPGAKPDEPPKPGRGLRTGGIVLGGIGLAVAVAGVVLGIMAKGDESDINDALAGGAQWSQDMADR